MRRLVLLLRAKQNLAVGAYRVLYRVLGTLRTNLMKLVKDFLTLSMFSYHLYVN